MSDSDYSGPVVLYAKWTDRFYYVDIPSSVSADGSELAVNGTADGLYDGERVSVFINSENDWNLKDGSKSLPYELREEQYSTILENNALIMTLSNDKKSSETVYTCNVKKEPEVSGQYKDTLTFQIGFDSEKYTVRYEGNGGFQDDPDNPGQLIAFESETLDPGTVLDNLPIAIKSGHTFLGWCYDEACTDYVATTDRLLGNITLYASYTENQPLEYHQIATFARAIDVDGTSFVIQVTDNSGTLTTNQILAACTLKNLSDANEDVTLEITAAGNNTYTLSKKTGWKEGSSYKLILDNSDLYFMGFDTTIREYEISIHKEEVHNLELNHDIRYINIKDLSNLIVNGQSVQSVSIATMTIGVDGTVKQEGSSTTGSFTYTGKKLEVGDQIAVYSGDVIPTLDNVSASDSGNDISFFEITGVNGNDYSYRGSDTEDVLFMPDVLPLDISKDQDGDAANNSVTVDIADLTFGGDEMSLQLQLDEDTTVDQGDFLAFYTDIHSGSVSYGKIISVIMSEGKYILEYQPQSWEEVKASMDVYSTEDVDGEDLLQDTDVTSLTNEIENQAVASGFADEVAQQIADLAMRTESFEELEKTLEEELGAEIEVYNAASAPGLKATIPKRVEVGMPQVKADLDTKLRHFDGKVSGLHLGLEVSVPVTFHVARYADFTITITATFEQEVRVAINVDGEAIWKTWGIFPYIADYRATASLDLYEYTGIGLDINFKTEEANNWWISSGSGAPAATEFKKKQKLANDIDGIVGELEDMMENGREYISDTSPLMVNLGQQEQRSRGITEEISVAKSLAERYADLLEDESDWVEVYAHNLTERHFRVILVIDIAIKLDFVVSVNMNVSMGMSFWYKNAKRYVFNLEVKARKATSDTINISEEQYELTAYAMGTIGIKAGVRLTVLVGLGSTELAAVGISAEVGGYVQVWGYLYYILKYTASEGRDTRFTGALYLEIGIYLDIKFRAQAFSNCFTFAPTLYEAMWPLYTVGTLKNVLEFTNEEDLEYNLKRSIKNIVLPEDFFSMNYMDMKEGLDEDGEYFTEIYEDDSDKYFVITISNDYFRYDPKTNMITAYPGEEKSIDAEMTVTWKNQPGTFNTNPYQRKIKLHWDKLRDGYFISFVSNGGTYVNPITQKYGTQITKPQNPTKQGYEFAGWYQDEELTIPYTIPETMPDVDTLVYAKWVPALATYTVKNYVEAVSGNYEIPKGGVVRDKAYTLSQVSPTPDVREGFETPVQRTATVKADGSTLIEYYYPRNKYAATFKSDDEVVSSGSFRYGTMLSVPAVYKPGYEFKGWIPEGGTAVEEIPETVQAKDVTYFAKWEPLTDIGYTVKYYVQNQSGSGYTLSEIRYLTGTTGETVTAPDTGYSSDTYHLKDGTVLPSGVIAADGSLELSVYYDLNTYTLTYDLKAADAAMPEGTEMTITAKPGETIIPESPKRDGYRFEGWYVDENYSIPFEYVMPSKDLTIYANWERNSANYVVRHYQENIPILNEYGYPEEYDVKTYTLIEEEVFTDKIGTEVSPEVKNYEGFTAPAVQTETVTVDTNGNGTLVIEYRYDRNLYTLEWAVRENSPELVANDVYYGAPIIKPEDKEVGKTGYIIAGWYTDEALQQEFTYEVMPAQDLKVYPKWEPTITEYFVLYEFYTLDENAEVFDHAEVETYYALAGSELKRPGEKEFTGCTFDESTRQESIIFDPENTDIVYKYFINKYTLTYQYETNEEHPKTETFTKRYGDSIVINDPERDGYAFAGWYTDQNYENRYTGLSMPAENLTLYGKWVDGLQSYQVAHYMTELDGSMKLFQVENLYGTPGEVVTPSSKAPEGFEDVTPVSHTLIQGSVVNNRITYVYPRKTYQITFHLNGGASDQADEQTLLYGETISNYPYRDGYEFVGWYLDADFETPLTSDTVPASDLTLYAKWNVLQSTYQVEHYLESSYTDDYTLERREYFRADTDSTVEPAVKQYTGYSSPSVQQGVVNGDYNNQLVIKYYYECKEHQLTMHGVCKDSLTVEDLVVTRKYGASIPSQYRFGYTFGGWFKDQEYTEPFTGMMPDEDLTVYAKWIPDRIKYTVTHYVQQLDGEYVADTQVDSGEVYTDDYVTPVVRSYEGTTAPEVKPVQIKTNTPSNISLRYSRNIHTVTFVLDNGQPDVVRRYYYGAEVIVPSPTKRGYTFAGWDKTPSALVNGDATYTAKWIANTYTLSFTAEDATNAASFASRQYKYGEAVGAVETPVRPGYKFAGWDKSIPTIMEQDVHLNAKWSLETYTISYDLQGGTISEQNPQSYTYESPSIVLKAPSKAHNEFEGWIESGTGVITTTIPKHSSGNRKYTAKWKENTYKISFLPIEKFAWGGMPEMEITVSQGKNLTKFNGNIKGYSFAGWSLTPTNQSVTYRDGQYVSGISSDMKLYPVFKPNKYRITFDYNAGYIWFNDFDYGSEIAMPQIKPGDQGYKLGYVLKGWEQTDDNGNGYGTILPTEKVMEWSEATNLTMTAQWYVNDSYSYRPSKSTNAYVINDDEGKDISFTFYLDEEQEIWEETGDIGLGEGADYVINMDNMSFGVLRERKFKTIEINGSFRALKLKDGYAVLTLSYVDIYGKTHKCNTYELDLSDSNNTKSFSGVIKCPDNFEVRSLVLNFSARGGGDDEYIMDNLKFDVKLK